MERRTTDLLDRVPPHSPEIERGVLGACLLEVSTVKTVGELLRPSDFHVPGHRTLFKHLLAMPNGTTRGAVDIALLKERLKTAGDLEAVGGAGHLGECAQNGYVLHVPYYCHILREHTQRREIVHTGLDMVRLAYGGEKICHLDTMVRRLAERRLTGAGENRFAALTPAQLAAAECAVTYLVDNTLVADQPTFIGGPHKSLKTLIAVALAIALSTGTPFLALFEVLRTARVVYFFGEGGISILQEYAARIARAAGLNLNELPGPLFCDRLPQLDDDGDLLALQQFFVANEIEVAFIDPLYLCFPSDEAGNLLRQGKVLSRVNRLCLDVGVTPVFVHHLRRTRTDAFSPPELNDLAWAGFAEFAATWLLLGRRESYNADQPGEHHLWLHCGGRAGHSALHALDVFEGHRNDLAGRRWEVDIKTARESGQDAEDRQEAEKEGKRQAGLEKDKEKVLRALVKYPTGETERTLHTASGLYGKRFKAALADLIQMGDAVPCEITRQCRKTPYSGWKMGEEATTYE